MSTARRDGSSGVRGRCDAVCRVTAEPCALPLPTRCLASYRRAIACVAAVEPQLRAAAAQIAEIWERGGRCVYLGAGAAGLVAARGRRRTARHFRTRTRSACLSSSPAATASVRHRRGGGRRCEAARGREMRALGDLSHDALIAVSASGSTPFTSAAAQAARRAGAFVVAIANRPGAPLLADGRRVPFCSTPAPRRCRGRRGSPPGWRRNARSA